MKYAHYSIPQKALPFKLTKTLNAESLETLNLCFQFRKFRLFRCFKLSNLPRPMYRLYARLYKERSTKKATDNFSFQFHYCKKRYSTLCYHYRCVTITPAFSRKLEKRFWFWEKVLWLWPSMGYISHLKCNF